VVVVVVLDVGIGTYASFCAKNNLGDTKERLFINGKLYRAAAVILLLLATRVFGRKLNNGIMQAGPNTFNQNLIIPLFTKV